MAGWSELSVPKLELESKQRFGFDSKVPPLTLNDDPDVMSACDTAPLSPGTKDLLVDVIHECAPLVEAATVVSPERLNPVLDALADLRLETELRLRGESSSTSSDTESENCDRFWEGLVDHGTFAKSEIVKRSGCALEATADMAQVCPPNPKTRDFPRPRKRNGMTKFGLGWEFTQPVHPVYVLIQIQHFLAAMVQCVELVSSDLRLCGVYEERNQVVHGACRFQIRVLREPQWRADKCERLWVHCLRVKGDTFAYHSLLRALGTHFRNTPERLPLVT